MASEIFVNLAVKDLKKSKAFFSKLGFACNPMFTDENAASMIIGKNIHVMLLLEKFFKGFLPGREICDTARHTETLTALSLESRLAVDKMIASAISAGGKEYRQTQDYGWMYQRAFMDLDGHIWELGHMDMEKMPEEMKKKGRG